MRLERILKYKNSTFNLTYPSWEQSQLPQRTGYSPEKNMENINESGYTS